MRTPALVGLAMLLAGTYVQAQMTSRLFGGARLHRDSTVLSNLPYDKNDLSATVAWELHESAAFWQLALDYGWDPGGRPTAETILTPQLNLLFRDRGVVGGVGLLRSYIDHEERGWKWTSVYYQFLLGLEVPVGKLSLTAYALYPFKSWRRLNDFKGRDLEYLAGIGLSF